MGGKARIEGVFTPMVVPFENDRIIFHGLAENVEKMNDSGLAGYFVLGTNGEYKSLSAAERIAVLRTVVKHRARGKIVMAGTGSESTHVTIENTLQAADLGADMVSILMPHFFAKKMTSETMASYIIEVASASPVPVVLYNNPSVAAGVTIKPDTVKLVMGHPNVIGIKDSSGETYKDNLAAAKESMCVLAGSANFFLELMKNGGTGGVLSLANVFPEACAKLFRLFKEGKIKDAEALDATLVRLNKEVSGSFGVAGVKAAMDICGYCGGAPRRPLRGLSGDQVESIGRSLAAASL